MSNNCFSVFNEVEDVEDVEDIEVSKKVEEVDNKKSWADIEEVDNKKSWADIEEKVQNELVKKVNNLDIQSLDSTGKSWADIEDDFPPPPKLVRQTNSNEGEFTTVSKKFRHKKDGIDIICIHCGKKFGFPQHKIDFFKEKNLQMPKRCRGCLNLKKEIGNLPRIGRRKTINLD